MKRWWLGARCWGLRGARGRQTNKLLWHERFCVGNQFTYNFGCIILKMNSTGSMDQKGDSKAPEEGRKKLNFPLSNPSMEKETGQNPASAKGFSSKTGLPKVQLEDSLTDSSLQEDQPVVSFKKKQKVICLRHFDKSQANTSEWQVDSTQCGEQKEFAKVLSHKKNMSPRTITGDGSTWETKENLPRGFDKSEDNFLGRSKSSIEHRVNRSNRNALEDRNEDFDNIDQLELRMDSDGEDDEEDDDPDMVRCYSWASSSIPMDLGKSVGGYKSECPPRIASDFEIDWDEQELTSFE